MAVYLIQLCCDSTAFYCMLLYLLCFKHDSILFCMTLLLFVCVLACPSFKGSASFALAYSEQLAPGST